MQAGSELLPHLNAAISAAFKAGEEILEVYSRPVEVTLKDDRSPLTEADLPTAAAHSAIPSGANGNRLPGSERRRQNIDGE